MPKSRIDLRERAEFLRDATNDALAVLECVALEFPSLVDGTDDEINGADFLDSVARAIHDSGALRKHLKNLTKG